MICHPPYPIPQLASLAGMKASLTATCTSSLGWAPHWDGRARDRSSEVTDDFAKLHEERERRRNILVAGDEGRPRIRVVTSPLNEARREPMIGSLWRGRSGALSLSYSIFGKKSSNIYVRSARREGDEDTNTREEREEEPRR